jgi:hypothetical protein
MSVAYFEEPITALDNRARSRSITNRFGRSMRCRSDSRSAVNRRTIRRCLNRCRRTTEAPERGPTSQGRSRYLERRRNYKRKSHGNCSTSVSMIEAPPLTVAASADGHKLSQNARSTW